MQPHVSSPCDVTSQARETATDFFLTPTSVNSLTSSLFIKAQTGQLVFRHAERAVWTSPPSSAIKLYDQFSSCWLPWLLPLVVGWPKQTQFFLQTSHSRCICSFTHVWRAASCAAWYTRRSCCWWSTALRRCYPKKIEYLTIRKPMYLSL